MSLKSNGTNPIGSGVTKFPAKIRNRFTKDRFPDKLWRIVNECTSGAIGWSPLEPDVIYLKYKEFTQQYLMSPVPAFKTKNIASFVRQLNLYGFYKVHCTTKKGRHPVFEPEAVHYFTNRQFRKDKQPIGMIRTYGMNVMTIRDGIHFQRAGIRRSSGNQSRRMISQMDATPASASSPLTFPSLQSHHFVPDLVSSLAEQDIDTHRVRFLSPKSPVARKKKHKQKQSDEISSTLR